MRHYLNILTLILPSLVLAQGYNFVGDSYFLGNNCYILTANQEWENGAIWYNQAIDLNEPYHLQFTANFGSNDAGADGMVFVLQQVGNDVIGQAGGGMGFEGFSPSLGVEFDTFQNFEVSDPPGDHLAVLTNGVVNHLSPNNLYGPFNIAEGSDNIEDGIDHIIDIFWDPITTEFQVWVDCVPRVDVDVDLLGTIFTDSPEVFWGFTGATGGFFNQQRICLDPFILGTPDQYETCPGEPVQLESTAAVLGSLNWEPAEFLDDPNSNSPIATVTETTTFTLTYSDLCNDTQTSETTVVVYDPSVDLGEDITACEDEVITLDPSGSFDELIWSDQSTDDELNIENSGEYWVEAIEGVCSAYDTILVEINPLPLGDNEFQTVCEGESFTVDLSDLEYYITWFDGSNETQRTFSNSGSYTYELEADGCSAEFFFELDVIELPEFDLSESYTICEGQSVILDTGLEDVDIIWSDGSTSSSIQVNSPSDYWAQASTGGCTYSDTTTVIVEDATEFEIEGIESLCPGESGDITALVEGQVNWTNGQTGNTITVSLPGTYTAFVTNENGCESNASFFVEAKELPSLLIDGFFRKCVDEALVLRAQSSDSDNLIWSDGSIGPSFSTAVPGSYTVSLANDCGLVERSFEIIDRDCNQLFYMPNAFTPDGDGLNDLFKVVSEGTEDFELRIFNRFGQEVFYTNDPSKAWNGSFKNNGYHCEAGLYVISYKLDYGENNIQEGLGHVTLIR